MDIFSQPQHCCYILHINDGFCFFYSAIGECDKAIEVYTSIPLTEFDAIVGIALAYFKKGLLAESIKGKHIPNSEYDKAVLKMTATWICSSNQCNCSSDYFIISVYMQVHILQLFSSSIHKNARTIQI